MTDTNTSTETQEPSATVLALCAALVWTSGSGELPIAEYAAAIIAALAKAGYVLVPRAVADNFARGPERYKDGSLVERDQ